MPVNHYHLEAAIAHLSKQVQLDEPDKHYILSKAKLGKDRLSWGLWAERPYDELCKELGGIFEAHPPEPDIIQLDELDNEKNVSLADIFLDVEGLVLALVTAREFITSSQKFSSAYLFFVLNRWDLGAKLWQLDYIVERNNLQSSHIRIKVDSGVILAVKNIT